MNSLLTQTGLALLIAGSLLTTSVTLAGNEAEAADPGRFGNWNAGGVERIKDLATIAGVRDNQLIGYGVVVGLNGTGDQTTQVPFSTQSLKNMLGQLGVTLPDGQVYAIAQGNLTVGGFGADGADGSRITVNVPSVGRIPNGATVEREVPTSFNQGDHLTLNLRRPDFTTAYRMADVINASFGDELAQALDGSSVQVRAPRDPNQRVTFVSMLENLTLEAAEPPARVVINARTGTVVMGAGVTVRPAAISHGNLTVTISENPAVATPGALVGPQTDVEIEQEQNRMFLFEPGTALGDIVEAVNEVGAAPGDLVAILEALREAGALRAELVVI